MIILFSPTKTQKAAFSDHIQMPLFHEKSLPLRNALSSWNLDTIQMNYKVSEKIAQSVFDNFASFHEVHQAIHCYQGSTFKNMNAGSWSSKDTNYAQEHLMILSALYGLVRPLDTIGLYRLDFATSMDLNLYDYWRHDVTTTLNAMQQPIINLASREYSDMIDQDEIDQDFITIEFKEKQNDTFVIKGTYAKIARGKMANILIQQRINTKKKLKSVTFDDYTFNQELSTATTYIYTR